MFKLILSLAASLVLLSTLLVKNANAFSYADLPPDNLIQNAWFQSNCTPSLNGWQLSGAPWGTSEKFQDPTPVNCNGDWTGYAARFARNAGSNPEFYPNQDAVIYQVVQSPNQNNRKLHFHALFVGHRVNQYKAEIYGGPSANGPWTLEWTPFNVTNCNTADCMNAPFNQYCLQDRTCLWDLVSENYLGGFEQTFVASQAYAFYKIEFLMNYPEPDQSATGDVGGKLARVYFKTSPTNDPSPTPSPSSTPTPSGSGFPGDANNDGTVNIQDYVILSNTFGSGTDLRADFNGDGVVNIQDFIILSNNFGQSYSASNLQAATGIEYRDTLPSELELKTMADSVISQIQPNINGQEVKLVIVNSNAGMNVQMSDGSMRNVGEYIRDSINSSARLAGEGTGSDKYPPLADGYFQAPGSVLDKRSLAAMAITGDSLQNIYMATEQTSSIYGRSAEEYYSDSFSIGESIGNYMLNNVADYQTKTNLIIPTGPYHGNFAERVLTGLKEGLISAGIDLNYIKFIGAGGADSNGSSFNDTWQGPRSLTGLFMSGDFSISLSGSNGFPECPHIISTQKLTNIKNELGGNPDVLFYVPGHPDNQVANCAYQDAQDAYNQMHATIQGVYGSYIPTIGNTGASEIGHLNTNDLPIGDVYHFFVAGLKSN